MWVGFVGGMREESSVWCVSDFGTHSEDLDVMKVCAVGAADQLYLAWADCVFACYTIYVLGHVSICRVVDFIVLYFTFLGF
jgi:hypothetical protein